MFLVSLLRFYPGFGRLFFLVPFALLILLGKRLMWRFLSQPGRSGADAAIPVLLVLVLLLLLIGCVLRWLSPPVWLAYFLLISGRIYPLGALLEGLLIGLLIPPIKPLAVQLWKCIVKRKGR